MFDSSGYSIFVYVTLSVYFLLNYLDFNLILTSFVYTFKTFYTLLIPDDADWITSELLYIYLNKLY